jgi:hypothetical protein
LYKVPGVEPNLCAIYGMHRIKLNESKTASKVRVRARLSGKLNETSEESMAKDNFQEVKRSKDISLIIPCRQPPIGLKYFPNP